MNYLSLLILSKHFIDGESLSLTLINYSAGVSLRVWVSVLGCPGGRAGVTDEDTDDQDDRDDHLTVDPNRLRTGARAGPHTGGRPRRLSAAQLAGPRQGPEWCEQSRGPRQSAPEMQPQRTQLIEINSYN